MTLSALKIAILALIIAVHPALAQQCRQALLLGLDVSLSVNPNDFALQRQGLARALTDPGVMDAMTGDPGNPVDLAVFEWSGQYDQNLLVDWTTIDSRATLKQIASTLARQPLDMRSGRTALGAAMLYARELLLERHHCTNLTLDLSGDGMNNNGILPDAVQSEIEAAGISVNGLVIEPDPLAVRVDTEGMTELAQYFQTRVIVGPNAFVESIIGFQDYEDAMRRKLLRELSPALVKSAPSRSYMLTARSSSGAETGLGSTKYRAAAVPSFP